MSPELALTAATTSLNRGLLAISLANDTPRFSLCVGVMQYYRDLQNVLRSRALARRVPDSPPTYPIATLPVFPEKRADFVPKSPRESYPIHLLLLFGGGWRLSDLRLMCRCAASCARIPTIASREKPAAKIASPETTITIPGDRLARTSYDEVT